MIKAMTVIKRTINGKDMTLNCESDMPLTDVKEGLVKMLVVVDQIEEKALAEQKAAKEQQECKEPDKCPSAE